MNAEVQLAILQELRRLGGSVPPDPDSASQTGMKVLRTMERMRELRRDMIEHPDRLVNDYLAMWESKLDARGRPWGWRDVTRHIPFGRMKTVQRCYLMMGASLDHLLDGNLQLGAAQLVQSMKALHQFTLDSDWRAAWALTHLEDPFMPCRAGGTDLEMETILASLRTQQDLRERATRLRTSELLSEDDEDGGHGNKRKDKNKTHDGGNKGKHKGGGKGDSSKES